MIHVVTWCWGSKYPPHYAERLRSAVARNLKLEHRFLVCRPRPADEALTKIPGCFARLRTFDPAWQAEHGIAGGDRIVCLDLDLVVTGDIGAIVHRAEPFIILQGVNAANPCRYNGSVWSLRAGYRPDVWSDFSIEAASAVPHYLFPEDQAWFAAKMPDAGAYGPHEGVYGFQKPGWPEGERLPANACLVAFFGRRDPNQFVHLEWVQAHWR